MKSLNHTIRIAFLCFCGYSVWGQSPQFSQNLNTQNPNVCFGDNVTYSTTVLNATYYAFETQNLNDPNWTKISEGNITLASTVIEHTLHGVTSTPTLRVLIVNGTDSVYSNQHSVTVNQPNFDFHPTDLVQCNGEDATFRVASPTAILYQWETSADGGTNFTDLNNTAKFKNVTTSNLTVSQIINDHHGIVFRCRIRDNLGCEAMSNSAKLTVNKLSANLSPTTSKQFCEGDTARFYPLEVTGDTTANQWQLRRSNESTYSNLSENAKFIGVNAPTLTVNGILPAENSYRLRVGFKNTLQNPSGQLESSVCYLQSVRANYTVNPRPSKPSALDTLSHCGPNKFNIVSSESYNWYSDTLSPPLLIHSKTFQTTEISENTLFYYSWRDSKGCESFKQHILTQIHEVPTQTFGDFDPICPSADSLTVQISNISGTPHTLFASNLSLIASGTLNVPIDQSKVPLNKSKESGEFRLELFSKNQHCYSDTTFLNLRVLKPTRITKQPSDLGICMGEKITIEGNYEADLPVSIFWQKENVILNDQNDIPLIINSALDSDAGNYRFLVNGACGSDTSSTAAILVSPAIDILQQPVASFVCNEDKVTLKVKASGSGDLNYQWYINNVAVGTNTDSLVLENVSLDLNDARIFCKIESNCSEPAYTQEVTLTVHPLPPLPVISDTLIFCTNSETLELSIPKQNDNTLQWYNQNQEKLANAIVNKNDVNGKTLYISQTDHNGCESKLKSFIVDISPGFSISIVSNTAKLCSTGYFNRTGSLVAYPNQTSSTETSYTLLLNENEIDTNTSGNFDFSAPGQYTIKAKRGNCSSNDSIAISAIGDDLQKAPITSHVQSCSGEIVSLTASSDYAGGNYFWWTNAKENLGISMGKDLLVKNILQDSSFYVSYGKETEGLFCESPRAEVKVSLGGNLTLKIATTSGTNCSEKGSVQITSTGQNPIVYTLNDSLKNNTGIFSNLIAGTHTLKAIDATGCSKDTTFILTNSQGPLVINPPSDSKVCVGNLSNFTFSAENYDSVAWYRKLPNDSIFRAMEGENSPNLRITNSGNTINPHLSRYKAVLMKGDCQTTTSEVSLLVNSITGTNATKTFCENDTAFLDLENYTIIGKILSYQWQYREGTTGSFTDLDNENSNTITIHPISIQNAGYYRNRVVFDNDNGRSCIINSSTNGTRIIVNPLPKPRIVGNNTICLGQTTSLSVENCNGVVTWSDGKDGTTNTIKPTETIFYSALCNQSGCTSKTDSVLVSVLNGIQKPLISVSKTDFCFDDSVIIQATNCEGTIHWSNGQTGESVNFLAENSISISALCVTEKCQSPSSDTLKINVSPKLMPGTIAENTEIHCAGYNPPVIANVENPNTTQIQWQISQDCITWQNIEEAKALTYNPPTLSTTTCYRRMVWNSCDTLYSNIITIEIVPDPVISISADKTTVCSEDSAQLTLEQVGGTGNCTIQWLINKVSPAVSNANWRELATGDKLNYSILNSKGDSTFHFMAKVRCDQNTCNQASSNVQSILFKAPPILSSNLKDTTVCAGSSLILSANCQNGTLLWSNGSTASSISVAPTTSQIISLTCSNACSTLTDSVRINVINGIAKPLITVSKTDYCFGDSLKIQAINCDGAVHWSNGQTGSILKMIAEESLSISALCSTEKCQSPSSDTLKINVSPKLMPGSIAENTEIHCAGYNPPVIASVENPNTTQIQWQISQDCVTWQNIEGANALTYNPPTLSTTTCYRRMVWNSCDTLFSNLLTIEIVPDPIISINADKTTVCSKESVQLTLEQLGGTGNCTVQWLINKVSPAVSNANWRELTTGDALNFGLVNSTKDSTFHFMAKVSCDQNTCNQASSNVQSIVFKAPPILSSNLKDTTVCAGSSLILSANCQNGTLLWSNGSTSATISVNPMVSSEITARCFNDCSDSSKVIKIEVTEGILPPESFTKDSLFLPDHLAFRAVGENLKWYTSEFSIAPLDSSPVLKDAGVYTFWVSQTIGHCESPRLPITASLFANIRIISQTTEMINCYGNVSNIVVNATGSGTLKYTWQRKLPGETDFSNVQANNYLSRENTASLRVGSTGNADSPTGTLFRCSVSDDFGQFTSAEILITANRIEGSLANQDMCIGQNLNLNLNNSHRITGTPINIQWQHRSGTGNPWQDLSDTGSVKGSNTLALSIPNLTEINQLQFRCSISFLSNSGSCVETSDLMTLRVGTFPDSPNSFNEEICQGESLQKFSISPPGDSKINWYRFQESGPLRTQPSINTSVSGTHTLYYSFESKLGCESSKAFIHVTVNPSPPQPINTTPSTYEDGPSLTFSAIGENLKWYRTKTLKPYEDYAPTFNTTGQKNYYVTQTDQKGCESERLLIQSRMLAMFRISTQPQNQSACDGNTATFSVRTAGGTNITYQWQIDHQGVFIDLPGETSRDLKISDSGVSPFIDGSKFRCLVSYSDKKLISNTAELRVNYLKSVLPEINLCEGQNLSFERYADSLSGIINKIEWQRRTGSTYATVFESSSLSEHFTPDSGASGSYRLRVTFHNLGGGSCVRNSNVIRFNQHVLPRLGNLDSISICAGQNLQSMLKKLPPLTQILQIDSTELEPMATLAPESSFLIRTSNNFGCSSTYKRFSPIVLPVFQLENIDSVRNVCLFSEMTDHKVQNMNTLWFLTKSADIFTENRLPFEINKTESREAFYSIKGENGCLSQKYRMQVNMAHCYFDGGLDTCLNTEYTSLDRNNWNYFYKENGQIYGAVHPNGQNMGRVEMRVMSTLDSTFEDWNMNQFYPRTWTLNSSRSLSDYYKVRLYLTLEEIKQFKKNHYDSVTILRKNKSLTSCEWEPDTSTVWLENYGAWIPTETDTYYFIEFETRQTGQFLLWSDLIPQGNLQVTLNTNQVPELSIDNYKNLPLGKYVIYKSESGEEWKELQRGIEKSETVADMRPYMARTHYQLMYDFENGIKALLDSKAINIPETFSQCTVLGNPNVENNRITVYFPEVDKNKILLTDLLGREIPLKQVSQSADRFEINPLNFLAEGMYILKMTNTLGNQCVKKIYVF